jgi:hypothetical protein
LPLSAASVANRHEEGDVLGVGIDWAEEFHLVALGSPAAGITEILRVEHQPEAVVALLNRIGRPAVCLREARR